MKYAFVDTHRTGWRVERLCAALSVSRSGYYAWRTRPESPRAQENRRVLTRIRTIHADAREAYGAVKTWRVLRAQGVACGRHRVARLRRAHGMEARRMRRFRLAYQARNSDPAAPNLVDPSFRPPPRTGSGRAISRASRPAAGGCTWPCCWTCTRAASWAGP